MNGVKYRFPTKEAICSLNSKLSLPATGLEQDWEIELADRTRVSEFLALLDNKNLDDDEKFALMALTIASFDEALNAEINRHSDSEKIKKILCENRDHFQWLIEYWSCGDTEDEEELFAVSRMMREIKDA